MGRRKKKNTNGNVQRALMSRLDELNRQMTGLTTTISKMDNSPEPEPEPEPDREDNEDGKYRLLRCLKRGSQTLITWIPVISLLLSGASLYVSTRSFKTSVESYTVSRTEWLKSGPQFNYIVRTVAIDDVSGVPYEIDDETDEPVESGDANPRLHFKLSRYDILLSNTGRLKATVLSVHVKNYQTTDFNNQCTNVQATIEPGESRLFFFGAQKMKPDVNHLSIFVNTADGQRVEAKKLTDTDKTSADLAHKRASAELAKEGGPVCTVYINGDKKKIRGSDQAE